jgi:hypothetical protein
VLSDRAKYFVAHAAVAGIGELRHGIGELGRNTARDCHARSDVYVVHVLKLVRLGSATDLSRQKWALLSGSGTQACADQSSGYLCQLRLDELSAPATDS